MKWNKLYKYPKSKSVPVEEVLSFTTSRGSYIKKNCYIIHPSGGKHAFYSAKSAKGTIYCDLIWPWVERIGEVKTKQKKDNRYLKPTCGKDIGYPYWTFYIDGPLKKIKINDAKRGERWLDRKMHIGCHQLVAKAFISKPENLKSLVNISGRQGAQICINHINEIKADYRVSNLEWVTLSKNSTGTRKDLVESVNERYLKYKANGWA
tara:strand:- start:30 stop:650 length:621 start_codon:yes stop_codon:yes gene_type:complete